MSNAWENVRPCHWVGSGVAVESTANRFLTSNSSDQFCATEDLIVSSSAFVPMRTLGHGLSNSEFESPTVARPLRTLFFLLDLFESCFDSRNMTGISPLEISPTGSPVYGSRKFTSTATFPALFTPIQVPCSSRARSAGRNCVRDSSLNEANSVLRLKYSSRLESNING
ncbi:hypothetical protein OGATHE_001457 [Ogataea polymorpha]|uniref:Uncharacterized protein n=1 Tax=Ogataea polymorpha TaxID=460523 RepID=A0A9P8PRH1_9ASCO|nr:hypothetical protein OGATHE_001457 [Ogataea polymorpha]